MHDVADTVTVQAGETVDAVKHKTSEFAGKAQDTYEGVKESVQDEAQRDKEAFNRGRAQQAAKHTV